MDSREEQPTGSRLQPDRKQNCRRSKYVRTLIRPEHDRDNTCQEYGKVDGFCGVLCRVRHRGCCGGRDRTPRQRLDTGVVSTGDLLVVSCAVSLNGADEL